MNGNSHPLDNVVWAALTGVHAAIATGRGLARHYPRDMAPFSAVAEPTAHAYADLAESLSPGVEARLFRPCEEPAPSGWETLSIRPIVQMVIEDRGAVNAASAVGGHSIEPLTIDDAADMLALAEIAKPGPLGARAALLGSYFGVREPSTHRLIAVAGERFRLDGYVELSAISVHPDARGRGLGRAVTLHLMRQALERAEIPFLHVFPDNPALALYTRWGFRERARHYVIWQRPVATIVRGSAAT
jgi:ribosomal protein S18 acetylase RimI-like enzyme